VQKRSLGEACCCQIEDGMSRENGVMILQQEKQMPWKAVHLLASKIPQKHKITMILQKGV
jgi:hypothetical protein